MQVQEFEHINGYYSMPEVVRKPVEPVKGGEGTPTTSTSTSATPATSAAPSPAPPTATATSAEDGKEKEVCEIKVLSFIYSQHLVCVAFRGYCLL